MLLKTAKRISKLGGFPGLVMRNPDDDIHRYFGQISTVDFAEAPYDVAVGYVKQPSRACFLFGDSAKTWMWEDVYTAGYPETAKHHQGMNITIDVRGHKGQVLRTIKPGHVLLEPHPAVIEVSFPIAKGLSGAPLVMRNAVDDDGQKIPYFILVGVCVAKATYQLVDFSHTQVQDDGKEFKETTKRIEEYGIAHDLRPLANWSPESLGGVTLRDAVRHDIA